MARATFGFLFCLSLAFAAGVWLRAESRGQSEPEFSDEATLQPLEPGVPFAVECPHGSATIVLPASPSGRYALVIGSLGNPEREFEITLRDVLDGVPSRRWHLARRVAAPSPRPSPPLSPRIVSNAHCGGEGENRKQISPEQTFFLHDGRGRGNDPAHCIPLKTTEIARGPHIRVLADQRITVRKQVRQSAAEIVRLFEEEIRQTSLRLFGPPVDFDGNGCVTVVLTPSLNDLPNGGRPLLGLVHPNDFRTGIPRPFGNQSDILFLNANVTAGPTLKALLAHEYTHVVCFSRRFADRSDAPFEDDWLSEGIAHVSERLHDAGLSNLQDRLRAFEQSPQTYPLVVPDYQAAGLWRNPGCRGATYRFLNWCVGRYGIAVLRRLIDGRETGVANLEHATGVSFETLFREWSLSLLADRKIRRLRCESSAPLSFPIRGTAVAIVEIDVHSGNDRRMKIHSNRDSRLQISLIRLP